MSDRVRVHSGSAALPTRPSIYNGAGEEHEAKPEAKEEEKHKRGKQRRRQAQTLRRRQARNVLNRADPDTHHDNEAKTRELDYAQRTSRRHELDVLEREERQAAQNAEEGNIGPRAFGTFFDARQIRWLNYLREAGAAAQPLDGGQLRRTKLRVCASERGGPRTRPRQSLSTSTALPTTTRDE